MMIIKETLTGEALKQMAERMFGDMVKAVVDVRQELLAVDAELHADLEALLIEFDSMINMRPSQANRSRGVEDETIRKQIMAIVAQRIAR